MTNLEAIKAKIDKLTLEYTFLKRDRNQPLSNEDQNRMAELQAQTLAEVTSYLDELGDGPINFDLGYWFESLRATYGPIEYFTVPAKCFSCGSSLVKQNGSGFLVSAWITGCRKCHRSLCD